MRDVFCSLMMVLLNAFCISSICLRYLSNTNVKTTITAFHCVDIEKLVMSYCLPLAELLQVSARQTHVHLQGFDPVVKPHEHTFLLAGAVHRASIH